nr:TraR/DksA C4-type zinc finger protein [Nocardioides houyundeii]
MRSARKTPGDSAAAAAEKARGRRGVSLEDAEASTPRVPTQAPTPPGQQAANGSVARKAGSAKKAAPARNGVKKAAPARNGVKKAAPARNGVSAAKRATAGRKADPTTSSAASLVVKDGEQPWTQAELDEVLVDLHEHRDRLVEIMEEQERDLSLLMRDPGDGAGNDQADVGATNFERDHELTLMSGERGMLEQIDRALSRIGDGTYGVCESCAQPIGKMRVMAFPRATLCLSCKQREERR